MAENISQVSNNRQEYQSKLLDAMFVAPIFEQFALKGKLTGAKTGVWNRIPRIAPGTPAPLGDGTTPSPVKQTPEEITATADWYGAYSKVSRQSYKLDPNGQIKGMTDAIGQHGNELREVILRNAIATGASTIYYSGATARTDVATEIRLTELNRISRDLYADGAKYVTQIKKASTGVGTVPIGASMICVINGMVENDVRALTGFVSVEKYADSTPGYIGEIGHVPGYRFIKSNIMSDLYYASAGGSYSAGTYLSDDSSKCNVYPCLIFGEESFGTLDLEEFEMIIKGLEQAGSALNMYATMGYLFAMAGKVLNGSWCSVLEVAAKA